MVGSTDTLEAWQKNHLLGYRFQTPVIGMLLLTCKALEVAHELPFELFQERLLKFKSDHYQMYQALYEIIYLHQQNQVVKLMMFSSLMHQKTKMILLGLWPTRS
ncbi:hypothetical protein PSEUDO9AZ_10062 [Pseudomonas sp. 9AZ]|nr:hypothetical protein PSEUDO9AZ_10062 [Pseudomonas sp. 9AZ]